VRDRRRKQTVSKSVREGNLSTEREREMSVCVRDREREKMSERERVRESWLR
jgi:hypothetical protein